MKYIIVILCDSAPSFCHYTHGKRGRTPKLMPISVLTDVINMAMKENLVLQFVWPEYELPEEYNKVIKYTNHIDIRPYASSQPADIIVLERSELQRLPLTDFPHLHNVSIRLTFDEFISATQELTLALHKIDRLNISVEFPEHLQERAVCLYDNTLERLSEQIVKEYKADHPVQLNILTDRLSLSRMNNCNSGTDSLCAAPDGNLYICPGFYYDRSEPVGMVVGGFKIKNPQLYRLEYAPICRICDAYHCRRCVWQNQKSTLETNTPGHEQCVISHLERNASCRLLRRLREEGCCPDGVSDISEVDFLDPFYNLPRIRLK